jgi:hypothetical protein
MSLPGYKNNEYYKNLSSYDLLNAFALNYLSGPDSNIITKDKIITNGNCFFHALGFAYFISRRIDRDLSEIDLPENYAVSKDSTTDKDPSYRLVDTEPLEYKFPEYPELTNLSINYYNESYSIPLLNDPPNEAVNTESLKIKKRVAYTISRFNDNYNKHPSNNDKLRLDIVNDQTTKPDITIDQFIQPIKRGSTQYHPTDENSIYAAAYLFNKIICIISCNFDFEQDCYNIEEYKLYGPKNMKCTEFNTLFLLYQNNSHYETYYPSSGNYKEPQYFIRSKIDIVNILNKIIREKRPNQVPGIVPKQYENHFEYYEINPEINNIPIDYNKYLKSVTPKMVKDKVTEIKDELFKGTEEYIDQIDPNEKNPDILHHNEAILCKLIDDYESITQLLGMKDMSFTDPEKQTYTDQQGKIRNLIDKLLEKSKTSYKPKAKPIIPAETPSGSNAPPPGPPAVPPPGPPAVPPPGPPAVPPAVPTPGPPRPKSSTLKGYKRYSSKRPKFPLPAMPPKLYTQYIFRKRNFGKLTLRKPKSEP